MRRSDVAELLALSALWGSSFLLLRVAAPLFGPFALIAMRVGIASCLLAPLLALRGEFGSLREHWPHLLAVGVLNTAIPLCLFAYAELTLAAGFTSVINAAAPMFAAIVAVAWLHERISLLRVSGLVVGFAGVVGLVGGSAAIRTSGGALAVAAALLGTMLYGISNSYIKRFMAGVPSLAIATGSQLAATLVLAPAAYWLWPARTPTGTVWLAVIALGIACTGIAYILFFRLIARVGPTRVASVSFLIPVFGVLWGVLFLREQLTANMAVGSAVILLGTSLSAGIVSSRKPNAEARGNTVAT